jgi:four helix bundle protein
MSLVKNIYALTSSFPREEIYGLTSQIRRAAVSIPSNIAEGHAKRSTKEFHRFCNISLGSIAELETQLLIAESLNYADTARVQSFLADLSELGKMLNSLLNGLERRLKAA